MKEPPERLKKSVLKNTLKLTVLFLLWVVKGKRGRNWLKFCVYCVYVVRFWYWGGCRHTFCKKTPEAASMLDRDSSS